MGETVYPRICGIKMRITYCGFEKFGRAVSNIVVLRNLTEILQITRIHKVERISRVYKVINVVYMK